MTRKYVPSNRSPCTTAAAAAFACFLRRFGPGFFCTVCYHQNAGIPPYPSSFSPLYSGVLFVSVFRCRCTTLLSFPVYIYQINKETPQVAIALEAAYMCVSCRCTCTLSARKKLQGHVFLPRPPRPRRPSPPLPRPLLEPRPRCIHTQPNNCSSKAQR